MPDAGRDRRRLVALRVLELVVRRDHPLPPGEWAAVRRAARRGDEAPDELKAAVLADADAILHSSDLGIAPLWLIWGFVGLAAFTLLSYGTTGSSRSLLLVLLYLLIAGGAFAARKLRRARAETALLRNADPW
jgi:hypothetical protein